MARRNSTPQGALPVLLSKPVSGTLNFTREIREARAIAAGLREAACICLPLRGAPKARLVVAADALLSMATLAGKAIGRVEELQLELAGAIAGRDTAVRQLDAGGAT